MSLTITLSYEKISFLAEKAKGLTVEVILNIKIGILYYTSLILFYLWKSVLNALEEGTYTSMVHSHTLSSLWEKFTSRHLYS